MRSVPRRCADFSGSSVFCEKCSRDQENTAFVESQSKPRRDYDKILNEPVVEIRDPKKQRLEASIEKREKMYMAIVILGCVFLGFRLFTDPAPVPMCATVAIWCRQRLGVLGWPLLCVSTLNR